MYLPDIMPAPVCAEAGEKNFLLNNPMEIRLGSGLREDRAEELASLWQGFTCRQGELTIVRDEALAPFEAAAGAGAEVSLKAEDEYALSVTKDGVRVLGADETGLLHGLYTLLQMIIPKGNEKADQFELAAAQIHDHPKLSMRAVHLCLFPENTLTVIEKAIRLAGILKYSHVILEFWGTLKYDCLKELSWPDHSWSKEEVRRLIDTANRMGMEVIPMFNHLGHATQSRVMYGRHVVLDQNPALAALFEPDGWTWCLSNPKTHELLRKIRMELMDLCGPGEYFHLGCDEAYSFASCPECSQKDGPQMLADYLNGLTEELAACGRKPLIWADALLDSTAWERPTIATSRPDQKTHLALDLLDRRLIMADWQYDIKEASVPSAEYFMEKGFETVLCPWDGHGNIQSLGAAADELNAKGLMVTTWHHLPEMLRILDVGAEYGWRGAKPGRQFNTTGTAALLRRVMPPHPRYEEAGFGQYEVPQPDRWLKRSICNQ